MNEIHEIGPFRLDVAEQRLEGRSGSRALGRRPLALLRLLASRAGRLVSKQEILDTVWNDAVVTEGVLTTAVRELRRALGDSARRPSFIQTVHGRGYRLIAATRLRSGEPASRTGVDGPRLVGRRDELARLLAHWNAARNGQRKTVFVTGEAGIGKSALVDAFGERVLDERSDGLIARGQCIEQHGAGEPYMPLLEAIGRLLRSPHKIAISRALRSHAPSWLPHLAPGTQTGPESPGPVAAVPQRRMLRELTEALEVVARGRPLLLVLEDLHWSDPATLAWLDSVTRRPDPTCLLVVGTCRPATRREPALAGLLGELGRPSRADEIALGPFDAEDVGACIDRRIEDCPDRDALARALMRHTDGLPLFVVSVVDELARDDSTTDGVARWIGLPERGDHVPVVPASLRQFVERRLATMTDEQQAVLEAASVAGRVFNAGTVAAVLGLDGEAVERQLDDWARHRQLIDDDGSERWPDGTLTARYRFRHALFRDVVYRRIPAARKIRFHAAAGLRLERAHAERPSAVSAALALHFERGQQPARAIEWRRQAARVALQRSACLEAHGHLKAGLDLLDSLDGSAERDRAELGLRLGLGQALMLSRGWTAPEVGATYRRADALRLSLGDDTVTAEVLWGLLAVSIVRADLPRTRALARELLAAGRRAGDVSVELVARVELGGAAFGEANFAQALDEFDAAWHLYRPALHDGLVRLTGVDVGVFGRVWSAQTLWHLGRADDASTRCRESLALAQRFAHPFTTTVTLAYAAVVHQHCADAETAGRLAAAAGAICEEHGFPYYGTWSSIVGGWAATMRGAPSAIGEMEQGIRRIREQGVRRCLPYYHGLLAEALLRHGRREEARRAIRRGRRIARTSGECWWNERLERLAHRLERDGAGDGRAPADGDPSTSRA